MRFFFDNNLSPYLARAINELGKPDGTDVVPLADKFPRNTADFEWIAALGAEGDWSIVSHDRFTKNDLEKEAFRRSGLTAFILSKTWSNLRE